MTPKPQVTLRRSVVLIFRRGAQDAVDVIDEQRREGDQPEHGVEDKGVALTDLRVSDPDQRGRATRNKEVAKHERFDDRQETQG